MINLHIIVTEVVGWIIQVVKSYRQVLFYWYAPLPTLWSGVFYRAYLAFLSHGKSGKFMRFES